MNEGEGGVHKFLFLQFPISYIGPDRAVSAQSEVKLPPAKMDLKSFIHQIFKCLKCILYSGYRIEINISPALKNDASSTYL